MSTLYRCLTSLSSLLPHLLFVLSHQPLSLHYTCSFSVTTSFVCSLSFPAFSFSLSLPPILLWRLSFPHFSNICRYLIRLLSLVPLLLFSVVLSNFCRCLTFLFSVAAPQITASAGRRSSSATTDSASGRAAYVTETCTAKTGRTSATVCQVSRRKKERERETRKRPLMEGKGGDSRLLGTFRGAQE